MYVNNITLFSAVLINHCSATRSLWAAQVYTLCVQGVRFRTQHRAAIPLSSSRKDNQDSRLRYNQDSIYRPHVSRRNFLNIDTRNANIFLRTQPRRTS